MGLLGKWFLEKSKTTTMGRIWLGAWETVQSIVAHIEVTLRPTLQGVLADGKVTAVEASHLKAEALRIAKEAFGDKGLAQIGRYFGPAEVFLSGLIERALGLQRKAGTLPPPPSSLAGVPSGVVPIVPQGKPQSPF
jgi:hypothetical protein